MSIESDTSLESNMKGNYVMDFLTVEVKRNTYVAFYFDGTKDSAVGFARKFDVFYRESVEREGEYIIQLNEEGELVTKGQYILIDGKVMKRYTQDEFIDTFRIIHDSRQRPASFLSDD